MENQVPEEVSKPRFQKLLHLVQQIASEECEKRVGQVKEVLVEDHSSREGMMSGRLSENSVVHFVGDESLIGKIVKVKLLEAKGFYYIGQLED